MESNNLIDWELCLKLSLNKPEIAKEMLSLFLESLEDELSFFQTLHHQKDFKGLCSAIHRLHGASCYIGIPLLKKQLGDIERRLGKGETNIDADFKELTLTLESLIELNAE